MECRLYLQSFPMVFVDGIPPVNVKKTLKEKPH